MRNTLAIVAAVLAAGSLAAQTSSATTLVNQDGIGCQSGNGLLTGSVVVITTATVDYDAATGILLLTIDNTTPQIANQSTATITEVHLNLPPGAITGATLTNQTGSGGATPAFSLSFDDDTGNAPNPNSAGCLGDFNITLDAGIGSNGAIANPAATTIATPNPVLGPVTFELQLTGPGTGGIDAEAILSTISQGGPGATTFGLEFQGGGWFGQDSGFVGSCDFCRTSMYIVGPTSIDQTFDICVTGGFGCHACVWVSTVAGPTVIGGITLPIGLPIVASLDLGNFGLGGAGNSFCVPLTVPNDPLLVGFTFYVTNITYNALNLESFSFSPALTITIS